jgi:integrase
VGSRTPFGRVLRRGRIWYIRVRRSGSPEYLRAIGPSRTIAERTLAKMREALSLEEHLGIKIVGRATLAELLPRVLPIIRDRWADTTWPPNAARVSVLVEAMPRPLCDYDTAAVNALLVSLRRDRGLSPATVNRYRSLLSSVFQAATGEGYAHGNPVASLRPLREARREVPLLSDAQARALFRAIPPAYRRFCLLSFLTGARRAEIRGLRRQDVLLERQRFSVLGKGGRPRDIPIGPAAAEVLASLLAEAGPAPTAELFAGLRPDTVSRTFPRWVEAAGLPRLTYHGLRHNFASRALAEGMDIEAVRRIGGWSSYAMLLRYASHRDDGWLRRAAAELGRLQPPVAAHDAPQAETASGITGGIKAAPEVTSDAAVPLGGPARTRTWIQGIMRAGRGGVLSALPCEANRAPERARGLPGIAEGITRRAA